MASDKTAGELIAEGVARQKAAVEAARRAGRDVQAQAADQVRGSETSANR
jgi:hypothetical protein